MNTAYIPFSRKVKLTLEEWRAVPKNNELLRIWNGKLGLMQRTILGDNIVEEVPTRLPYKVEGNDYQHIVVDGDFYNMATKPRVLSCGCSYVGEGIIMPSPSCKIHGDS